MNRFESQFQNRIHPVICRTAAGFFSAVLAVSSFAMQPVTAYATQSGLIYGTQIDGYMQDDSSSEQTGSASETDTSGNGADTGTSGNGTSDGVSVAGSSNGTAASDESSASLNSSGTLQSYGSAVSIDDIMQDADGSSIQIEDSIDYGTDSSAVSVEGSSSAGGSTSQNLVTIDQSALVYGSQAGSVFETSGGLTIEGNPNPSYVSSSYIGMSSSFNEAYFSLEIYCYLRNQGFTSASACGVLGNIMRESSFEPDCTTGSAYGLFQCVGSLQTELREYCSEKGLKVSDPMAQTQAMILQIAPELFVTYGKNANNITYEQFKQLTDPQTAAETWRAVVERNNYSASDTSKRQKFAQNYYSKWSDYDGSGLDIIQEALKYVGNPYVWGGDSLTNGIDCSHYVCKILTLTGHYSGSYQTSLGLRSVGTAVSGLSEAQPGDILCWEGHVGLYITDGYYVNAAGRKKGICVGGGDIYTKKGGLIAIRRVR